jgi:hypothetical protein
VGNRGEGILVTTSHDFDLTCDGVPGLHEVHTLRDIRSTALIGLAIWESRAAYLVLGEQLAAQPEDPNERRDDWERRHRR